MHPNTARVLLEKTPRFQTVHMPLLATAAWKRIHIYSIEHAKAAIGARNVPRFSVSHSERIKLQPFFDLFLDGLRHSTFLNLGRVSELFAGIHHNSNDIQHLTYKDDWMCKSCKNLQLGLRSSTRSALNTEDYIPCFSCLKLDVAS